MSCHQIEPILIGKRCFGFSCSQLTELNVILQPNPFQIVYLAAGRLDVPVNSVGICEPNQIDARSDWETDPFPRSSIDVQQFVIAIAIIVDEFDFADSVVIELLQNIDAALDYFRYITRIDQATSAEIWRVLFQLSTDENSLRLPVSTDVTA